MSHVSRAVIGDSFVTGDGATTRCAPSPPSAHDGVREPPAAKRHKLVGHKHFKRHNPMTDRFPLHRFHHVEFWCGDATNTSSRFAVGLGMQQVAKSDLSTGNKSYASYALKSNDLMFVFSAPSYVQADAASDSAARAATQPHPAHDPGAMRAFCDKHGMAVRAVGVVVDDAAEAYEKSIANGGRGVLPPVRLNAEGAVASDSADAEGPATVISEVELYGDVVLRYVSRHGGDDSAYLPKYIPTPVEDGREPLCYGLQRLDHAVGNVHDLLEAVDYISGSPHARVCRVHRRGRRYGGQRSQLHGSREQQRVHPSAGERAHVRDEEKESDSDVPGAERRAGAAAPGAQDGRHLATVREMGTTRRRSGGFEFQKPASADYYAKLPERIGADALTKEQFEMVQELGLLVDKDDQGVLVQIFTKPLGDRPTVFIEIIQRIGCMREVKDPIAEGKTKVEQAAGCGGFGKGNFSELFKSIENYERTLKV